MEGKLKMRRESYLSKPPAVEVYPLISGTDIILRKNIEQVEREETMDGEISRYTAWECDEAQYRYKGTTAKDDVEQKFDYWLAIADGKSEVDAIDDQAKADGEPSVLDRLDALESGLAEIAEVICNG